MWDIIESGNFIPLNKDGETLARISWLDDHKLRYLLNSKARNILMCTLCEKRYKKVQAYKSVKDMWDMLVIIIEESNEVKKDILLSTWENMYSYD